MPFPTSSPVYRKAFVTGSTEASSQLTNLKWDDYAKYWVQKGHRNLASYSDRYQPRSLLYSPPRDGNRCVITGAKDPVEVAQVLTMDAKES